MSGEFIHTEVGTVITEPEYDSVLAHSFNSQATGDTLYASSATQLSRLGIGATNGILTVIGGVPTWQTTLAGLTLTSPTINGTIATTGLTMPAFMLVATASPAIYATTDAGAVRIEGGLTASDGAGIYIYGKSHGTYPGALRAFTSNASGDMKEIVTISGNLATSVMTLVNLTVTGLKLSGALDANGQSITSANQVTHTVSTDTSAVADIVTLGAYEISGGHRALAVGCEEAVVAETDETKFSHKLPVRINGSTYNLMLCAT